jgi:hypothetical protein
VGANTERSRRRALHPIGTLYGFRVPEPLAGDVPPTVELGRARRSCIMARAPGHVDLRDRSGRLGEYDIATPIVGIAPEPSLPFAEKATRSGAASRLTPRLRRAPSCDMPLGACRARHALDPAKAYRRATEREAHPADRVCSSAAGSMGPGRLLEAVESFALGSGQIICSRQSASRPVDGGGVAG